MPFRQTTPKRFFTICVHTLSDSVHLRCLLVCGLFPQLNFLVHRLLPGLLYLGCKAEPTGVHTGSYIHISQAARRHSVQLLFPCLSPLPSYQFLMSSRFFYLWIAGFRWQPDSISPPGNRAKLHRLCSSNVIDFCIICLYFPACACLYAWKIAKPCKSVACPWLKESIHIIMWWTHSDYHRCSALGTFGEQNDWEFLF